MFFSLDSLDRWKPRGVCRWDGSRGKPPGGGHRGLVGPAVLAGVLPHGVWGRHALCAAVPGDPEEGQQ